MFQPLPRTEPESLEDVFDDIVPTQRRPHGRTLIPPPRGAGDDEGHIDIRAILSEPPRPSMDPPESRPLFAGVEIQQEDDWQGDRTPPPLASDAGSIAPMAVSDTLPPAAIRSEASRAGWLAAGAMAAVAAVAGFALFSTKDGPPSHATQGGGARAAVQAPPVIAVEDLPIVGVVEPNGDEDGTIQWVTVLNEVAVWADREPTDQRDREREELDKEPVPASSEAPPAEEQPGSEPSMGSEPSRAGPFDRFAANAALEASAAAAMSCRQPMTPPGAARVSVTFAPSGRVTTATVSGVFAGTPEGGCIARTFRAARVEPFEGGLVTVHKTVAVR